LFDALEAFTQIFSPPLRKVMWKSLFLTAAVLLALAFCLDRLAASIMPLGPAWLVWLLSIVVALGLLAGVILLAPLTASLVAGFYLDGQETWAKGSRRLARDALTPHSV